MASTLPEKGTTYIPAEVGSRLARASIRVAHLEADVRYHRGVLSQLETRLQQNMEQLAQTRGTLERIYASNGWKWLNRYYRFRNLLLPAQSRRRAWLRTLLKLGRKSRSAELAAASRLESPASPETASTAPSPPLPAATERYARWIELNEPSALELEAERHERFERMPRVSVLLWADGADEAALRMAIQSMRAQTYAVWELRWAAPRHPDGLLDDRVRLVHVPAGSDAAEAYNAALAAATGDLVAVLKPSDLLAPFALYECVRAFNEHPTADFLYSDEDFLVGEPAARTDPHFKPDWSPDTLRSHNYVANLVVFSRNLLEQVGGFRSGFEHDENYDLALRASERAQAIVHIPKILYHRRRRPSAPTSDVSGQALQEHLARINLAGHVRPGPNEGVWQVSYALPSRPRVSIIIPNRDHAEMLTRCVDSLARSSYTHHEIIVVENNSRHAQTFTCYEELARRPNVRVLTWEAPFNYAAINNFAAARCAGEVLLFLNNDVEVINPDWLERLLEHALRPSVGAVGAKLYYPDDTIQHAGLMVGSRHSIWHYQMFADGSQPGYGNRLVTLQNVSSVTGACLMVRRAAFDQVQHFDERFAVAYNDVDLCLKLRQAGYLNVWTPYARLYHFESLTRGYESSASDEAEYKLFMDKWGERLPPVDPYFSPNLIVNPDAPTADDRKRYATEL